MAKEDEEVSEELLAATEQRMAAAGMFDASEEIEEEIEGEQTVEEEETEVSTPEKEQAEAGDESESTTSEASEDSQDDGLPDAYYRAALHQGWTPDEVNALYEQDSGLAIKTCKKLYDSTNKLSTEFANLGRAKIKQEEEARQEKSKPAPADLKLSSLKEQYGDDDPLVHTIEQMAAMLNAQSERQQQEQQQQQQAPAGDDASASQLLANFFSAPEMDGYGELYGSSSDPNKLTREQFNNRLRVATLADEIIVGATAMGRTMPDEEALEAAHLQVSEPLREQVIRSRIKKQVKRRAKSITLQPQGHSVPEKTDGEVSEKDLIQRTEARLAKINFNG